MASSSSKFKLSRRGWKLNRADDWRMLFALPKELPERSWAELLQKEETDLVCLDIREEIIDAAISFVYQRYIEKQTALFTVVCLEIAYLKLLDWEHFRHDPGEEPYASPACCIPTRLHSWLPDKMPVPSPKDIWASQHLLVDEDKIPEEVKWSSSLDIPVVQEIPKEYWFPGKVQLVDRGVNVENDVEERRSLIGPQVSVKIDYSDHDSTLTSEESIFKMESSEVLQEVTDYGLERQITQLSKSSSKTMTQVEGSLQGAGDSIVKVPHRKILKVGSTKALSMSRSMSSRRGVLPPIDDSKASSVSDCRLRGLRVETQHSVGPEAVVSVPLDFKRRPKKKPK